MLVGIEPADKESVTQTFFLITGLTQVEHDLTAINLEEFLDDSEYRLAKFHVTWRASSSLNVDTELIASTQHKRVLQHKTDSVLQTEVCSEIERRVILFRLTYQIR